MISRCFPCVFVVGNSLLIKSFCRQNIFSWVVHHCFACLCSFQTNCSFKIFSSNLSSPSFRIMWDLFLQNQWCENYVRTEVSVTSVFCLWFMLRYSEYHDREWEESDTCRLTILNLPNWSLKAQSGFTIHNLFLGVTISSSSILQGCVTRWQRTRACGQATLQQCSLFSL